MTRPLFRSFPGCSRMPYVELAQLPTPVEQVEPDLLNGQGRLFVKRDDLSGALYGGNKVRKLEFLMGEALNRGAKSTITFGASGSNHVLATAVYARELGLEAHSMLLPQVNARYVQKNLLAEVAFGAKMHPYKDLRAMMRGTAYHRRRLREQQGIEPYVIPFGGTSALGTVGFVNAALELAEQVRSGVSPEPDLVYAPMGSMGTVAGLAIGFAAAGVVSKVVAVGVIPESLANEGLLARLADETVGLLREYDRSFPDLGIEDLNIEIRHEFLGSGYAEFTEDGMEAIRLASSAGIELEGTYTGKTFAALTSDAHEGRFSKGTILFWNTYNSRDLAQPMAGVSYDKLPKSLQEYFLADAQPLDHV